jgi:hypothetical protein
MEARLLLTSLRKLLNLKRTAKRNLNKRLDFVTSGASR